MISHGDQSRNWFWWSDLSLNNPSTTRHSILDRIDCPEKVVIFRATLCGNIACNKLNFCYCTQTGKHLRRLGIAHVRQGHEHPCMLVFDNVSHAFVFFLFCETAKFNPHAAFMGLDSGAVSCKLRLEVLRRNAVKQDSSKFWKSE